MIRSIPHSRLGLRIDSGSKLHAFHTLARISGTLDRALRMECVRLALITCPQKSHCLDMAAFNSIAPPALQLY